MEQEKMKVCMLRQLPKEMQAEAMQVALKENPDNASEEELASLKAKRWKPGRTLKVHFMDGDSFLQSKVQQFARLWESYANIHFTFVNDPSAEVRVAFTEGAGSWSYLGTDCLLIDKKEPTMNFGWFDSDTPDTEFSRTIVHEFGHALGCPHEHQSPAANIPWDKEAVYKYFGGYPNYWSKDEIDNNLLNTYTLSEADATKFDSESIMAYAIPNSLTIGDFEVKGNTTLSELDKQFIGEMYPFGGKVKETERASEDLIKAAEIK